MDGRYFQLGDHFIMGNQTNNPHSNQSNDQKHSKHGQQEDDMSKRGGNVGKDPMDKDQKQRNDQSGSRSGNDRNRSGSQGR